MSAAGAAAIASKLLARKQKQLEKKNGNESGSAADAGATGEEDE